MAKNAGKLGFLLIAALFAAGQPGWSAEAVLSYPASFFAGVQLSTAYDMVGRLPGFVYDSGNNNRGYSGTAGNVVVDGRRPTAKTDDLTTILQRIPSTDVDHIDVIRGGAPGIDMQGQQVVANVVRKTADQTSLILTLQNDFYSSGHETPYGNVEFIHKSGGAAYDLTLTRFGNLNDDFIGDGTETITPTGQAPTIARAYRRGPDRMGWGLNGSASWPLFAGSFGVNLTLRSTAHNETLLYGAPLTASYVDVEKTRSAELGLHWDGDIGPFELNLVGLQRFTRPFSFEPSNDSSGVQVFNSVRDTSESIVRSAVRYHATPDLAFESGMEGAYNSMNGHTSDIFNGVPLVLVGADAHVHELRGELFAQTSWNISPQWSLEAGSHAEFSTIVARGVTPRSFAFLKPRLLLSWSPWEGQQFRLRAERVVGQLDFSNFIASNNITFTGLSAGNSGLKPDHRWQFEGDYETHFWDKGALLVSFLHEEIKDLVDYIPLGNGQDGPGNVPKATNDQFDVEFTLPLDKGWFDGLGLDGAQFKGSLLWKDSALADPVTGQTRPISNVNDRNLRFTWLQDMPGLDSSLNIGIGLPFTRPTYRIAQITKLRVDVGTLYLTASWDYKPTPDLDIQFSANNFIPYRGELELDNFSGPRNVSTLSTIKDLNIITQARFFVQLCKTF